MAFAVATVLVLMTIGVRVDSKTLAEYKPHITPRDLKGKITTTTFVLEQPRCDFTDVEEEDRIWLLVARSSAVNAFEPPKDPENLPYQSFNKNSCYMTLDTAAINYPCAESPDEITVLRVGTDTSCINDTPDCNGPLPDAGPYRVMFIRRNSTGNVGESKWSDDILLIQGKDYTTINTTPRRKRNNGMIAIASILSILSAVLLASFIAALIYKYSDLCGKSDTASIRDVATMTRYTTHHMYNHHASKS